METTFAPDDQVYKPRDAISATVKTTGVMAGAGLFLSAVQNSLARSNTPAIGVITRTGGIIATFAAMGASYEFVKTATANLREKDDSWNKAIGGACAGAALGIGRRSFSAVLGYGALMGVAIGVFDYSGGTLGATSQQDDFERRAYLKAHRRRPIEETIAEIGEGRGIRPPGYAERRRERLKERYGVDVSPEA